MPYDMAKRIVGRSVVKDFDDHAKHAIEQPTVLAVD